MVYLIQFHWIWLLLALLLGVAIGWSTCAKTADDRFSGWISTAAVIFIVGMIIALLRLLPGRAGYWLDSALLMFAVYIIGCCIGCWLNRRLDPEAASVAASAATTPSSVTDDERGRAAKSTPSASVMPTPLLGRKPATLAVPTLGAKDDLKQIKGVGPANEKALNQLGIFHFCQIADWGGDEITWVSHSLAFPGRIERERWVDQAQLLCRGQDTDYSRQVKAGAVKPDDAPLSAAALASLRISLANAPNLPSDGATISAQPSAAVPSKTAPVPTSELPSEVALPLSPTATRSRTPIGQKPTDPAEPTGGVNDDLKLIKGVGPKNETMLHDLGVFQFRQIASWSPAEAARTGQHLAFPGRIEREHWVDQAAILAHGGETDHARAVKAGYLRPSDALLDDADVAILKASLASIQGESASDSLSRASKKVELATPDALAKPEAAVPQPSEGHPGSKPVGLSEPTGGARDDLKQIKGIGPRNEKTLNDLGIFHFCQIADWTSREAVWTGHHIAFPGRIEREHWIDQARILCKGDETAYSRAIKAGDIRPSDAPLNEADLADLKAKLAEPKEDSKASVNQSANSIDRERVNHAESSVPQPSGGHPGSQPIGLAAPTGDAKDDLKLIKGIGAKNEKALNDLGIFHFCQIADWKPEEAVWTGHHMAFPGRIEREHWIDQAKLLCAGIETEHAQSVRAGATVPDDALLSAEEADKLKANLPEQIEAVASEDKHAGRRPLGLARPRGESADDLKRIKGIGPQNERRLHGLGIWHFDQVAAWSGDNIRWVGSYLAFPGRIDREQWVAQAKLLASGGATDFSKRVNKGVGPTSKDNRHGTENAAVVEPKDPKK